MFEISSHKVSAILRLSGAKIKTFFLFKVHGRFSKMRGPRELIFGGLVVLVGYNVTPHYQLLGSQHVVEIFKQLAAENMGKYRLNSAYNDPTNL